MINQQRDAADPAVRKPLTIEDPGSEALEPSPDDDEENPLVNEVVEEIDVTDDDHDDDDDDDEDSEDDDDRPDQKDVEPGSDAAADDAALGVGKVKAP